MRHDSRAVAQDVDMNGTGVRAGLLRAYRERPCEESACQRPEKRTPDHHSYARVLVVVGPYVLKIARSGALGHRDRRRHGAAPCSSTTARSRSAWTWARVKV